MPANYTPTSPAGSHITQPEQRPVVTTKLKSDKGYGIQIGVYTDYSNALVEVRRLEQKFNQPVNLYGGEQNGKQVYKVIVGLFSSKPEAQQFLDYLHRNDILGFIKDLSGL
jgi:cell division protein FtsN